MVIQNPKINLGKLKIFFILWSTQSLSQLGSSMTSFALTLWMYDKTGSALKTALMAICSYFPYVLMSIFAGALSDRWDKKKVMLVSDTLAACGTLLLLVLVKKDLLIPLYLYGLNVLNGLMNTVQKPASDVAMTLITSRDDYQRTSGLRSLSQSLITIFHPILATTVFAFGGMDLVMGIDLVTFAIAVFFLIFFVKIPKIERREKGEKEDASTLLVEAKAGLAYLKKNLMILELILFLAGVNLVASAFDAVLPAFVLPRENGGQVVLGMVTSCAGIATLCGSLLVTILPRPKNRIRVITGTMLFSLTIENFLLAFTQSPFLWCLGQVLGWLVVPIMGANLDVILRSTIPIKMQGRVFACRNTLQYFTIPLGLFWGGYMVDHIFEPVMAIQRYNKYLSMIFGQGKGSGAAIMMFILGVLGGIICIIYGKRLGRYDYHE